jgi:hypothetical protein
MADDKKKYNPRFGHGYSKDLKSGKKAIMVTLSKENLDALMKNVQIGSTLMLTYNKVTQYGNDHYFCDILPPQTEEQKKFAKKAATSDLD